MNKWYSIHIWELLRRYALKGYVNTIYKSNQAHIHYPKNCAVHHSLVKACVWVSAIGR